MDTELASVEVTVPVKLKVTVSPKPLPPYNRLTIRYK